MEAILKLINFPELIASAVGFLIFAWVLVKFLWKPTLNVIDERRESIEAAFQEVDEAREEVATLKQDYERKLSEISAEAQVKLQEAIERGQRVADELRQAAEEQREKMLAKTQQDITREKDKALAELRNTAIDLSFTITSRVLREGLEREDHDRLVRGFIDELKELN